MIYITNFRLPSCENEEMYLNSFYGGHPGYAYYQATYPFQLYPEMGLHTIEFEPITVFYGGNGSGKSTLLNVISQRLKAKRSSPYNTSVHMDSYVKLCSLTTDMRWCGEEYSLSGRRSSKYDIGDITHVITSDDIFRTLLSDRVRRDQILVKAEMFIESCRTMKRKKLHKDETLYDKEGNLLIPKSLNFETGENVRRFCEVVNAQKKSYSKLMKEKLGKEEIGLSNGENSIMQISQLMEQEGVYILDEPENSLSPEMQYKLSQLILYMARYNNCQIIIASHSPFLLGIDGARIYNLDARPVKVSRFEELDSMRYLYDFISKRITSNQA